jgi:transporter family protein
MNNWLAWSLLSALFTGATAVLAKIGVTGVDSNFATAIRTTVILLFTWMIASFSRAHWSFGNVSFRTWFFLILSGLATGLSWLCYFRALQLVSQLEIWNPRPGSSIRISGCTWLRSRTRLRLDEALEGARQSERTLTFSPVRSSLRNGSRNQFILVGETPTDARNSGS